MAFSSGGGGGGGDDGDVDVLYAVRRYQNIWIKYSADCAIILPAVWRY